MEVQLKGKGKAANEVGKRGVIGGWDKESEIGWGKTIDVMDWPGIR